MNECFMSLMEGHLSTADDLVLIYKIRGLETENI